MNSAVTRDLYIVAHNKFMKWARKLKMRLPFDVKAKQLDTALVKYMDEVLLLAGEGAGQARNTLFGTMWCRSLPKHASTLPLARQALKGFVRNEPSTSKDPIPLEAAIVIVRDLLSQGGLMDRLAAVALVMSFDLFTRPSETLRIKARDVVVSTAKRPKVVSVMIAQTVTYDGLDHRADEAQISQSAKIGECVAPGLPGLGLEFVTSLLLHMREWWPSNKPLLFPLDLAMYASSLAKAARRARLDHLGITPHSARHGGACAAAFHNLLDSKQIQKRGRWLVPSPTRRYKNGKLTRQVALMNAAVVDAAAADVANGEFAKLVLSSVVETRMLRREWLRKNGVEDVASSRPALPLQKSKKVE